MIISENNLQLAKLVKEWHSEPEPDWWKPGTRWKKGQPVKKCDEMRCLLENLDYLIEDVIVILTEEKGVTHKQIADKYGNPSIN